MKTKRKPLAMGDVRIQRKSIDGLRAAPYNPRTISEDALAGLGESLRRFGCVEPVIWNEQTGHIVGGHQRIKALAAAGVCEVDVVVVDLSDADEKTLNLTLNNPAIAGEFLEDALVSLLAEVKAEDPEGYEALLLAELAGEDASIVEGETDPDDVPSVAQQAISELGSVYLLGNHRLVCGNATEPDDVARLMDGNLADILLTDPPYNVGYVGKTKDALVIDNDDMDGDEFHAFLVSALGTADAVMRPGAVFYLWHAGLVTDKCLLAARDVGWPVRQCLIWVKNILVFGRYDYHWKHEPCLYGWKGGAAHTWHGDRTQTTVLEFDRPTRSTDHPTMKPVQLFAYLLRNNTGDGDRVLDLFGGSGTTIIAAEQLGRRAYVSELDPLYCDVIRRRWAEFVHGEGCDWQAKTPREG